MFPWFDSSARPPLRRMPVPAEILARALLLPEGTELLGVSYDLATDRFVFIVRSEAFGPAPAGGPIPTASPTYGIRYVQVPEFRGWDGEGIRPATAKEAAGAAVAGERKHSEWCGVRCRGCAPECTFHGVSRDAECRCHACGRDVSRDLTRWSAYRDDGSVVRTCGHCHDAGNTTGEGR